MVFFFQPDLSGGVNLITTGKEAADAMSNILIAMDSFQHTSEEDFVI